MIRPPASLRRLLSCLKVAVRCSAADARDDVPVGHRADVRQEGQARQAVVPPAETDGRGAGGEPAARRRHLGVAAEVTSRGHGDLLESRSCRQTRSGSARCLVRVRVPSPAQHPVHRGQRERVLLRQTSRRHPLSALSPYRVCHVCRHHSSCHTIFSARRRTERSSENAPHTKPSPRRDRRRHRNDWRSSAIGGPSTWPPASTTTATWPTSVSRPPTSTSTPTTSAAVPRRSGRAGRAADPGRSAPSPEYAGTRA